MKHIEKYEFTKQAIGPGSLIGSIYGLAAAPEGEKGEGLVHGLLRGLGIDVGASAGGGLGALAGSDFADRGLMGNPDYKKPQGWMEWKAPKGTPHMDKLEAYADYKKMLAEKFPKLISRPGQSALLKSLRGGAFPVLALAGLLGGGYGGHQIMDKFMGKAPYDE
jgi:hypothetical protein